MRFLVCLSSFYFFFFFSSRRRHTRLQGDWSSDVCSSDLVNLADELYRLTRDRVSHGVAAELDANRAMQKVNALAQQSQEAAQSYIAAKLTLANILQARITADFEVAD